MSETENKESQVQQSPATDSTGDTSGQHQEGIEHLKDNTSAVSSQPPASNPGSDDPTGGIAEGHGGVSSTADIGSPNTVSSPVQDEQTSFVGSTVDTVKGYLANLNLVGSGDDKTIQIDQEVQPASSSDSGPNEATVIGGSAGAVAASSASEDPALSTSAPATTEPQQSGSTDKPATSAADSATLNTASTAKEETMADTEQKDEPTQQSSGGEQESVEQKTAGGEDQKEEGGEEKKEVSEEENDRQNKKAATRENKDAIPTAGGERLGEKHWGESKMVPDVPKKSDEEKDGQPDQTTKDNTAANTGGAKDPSSGDSGEEKSSLIDKIKDKLPIGGSK